MFFNEMERIIEKQGLDGLLHLEFYYGMNLILLRESKSGAYNDVYGKDTGHPAEKVKEFIGILQGDDFFQSNTTQTPAFTAGFLYTRSSNILVGECNKSCIKG